ncbi:hypothetical protein Agabi119p4_7601 [Agaricus bisporus var. burnettii]|uniref:RING-type domain-containing protein n=1 Tax=Agaricus bisporus var. burnettii TaxID=192524 RepID=A0A8H7C8E1_AGABI|nr:hypothetical protein Agabi119p4_7601 [Agaricus bisporus var. burnettii]
MDTRDNDDHNDNNMQAENTTPAQPVAPAEIEMQDLDDSTVESSTSTPLNASTTSLASSLSERTGLRRTRVEDDHDDERDRRHPSERVGSPLNSPPSLQSSSSLSALHTAESASTSSTSGPPSFSGQLPASSNSAAPASSGPFRFFQHMPSFSHNHNTASPSHSSSPHVHLPPLQHNTTSSTDSAAPTSNGTSTSGANSDAAPTRPPRLNIVHQYLGGFAVSFDVNGVRTTVPLSGPAPPPNAPRANTDANSMATDPSTNGPAGENPVPEQSQSESEPQPQAQPQPQQQRRFPGDGGQSLPTNNTIADLLRHLSILTALSMGGAGLFERDMEDPERAKKLVDGLEDVPVGLVKRLERIGKASENNEDGSEADGTGLGDGGCAICWDRLLTKEKADEGQTVEDESTGTEPTAVSSDSHPPPPADPTTEEATVDANETSPGNYKRVVSLPCAHVFHAHCLVPWFSKPKQTTCPICRFNIDPENLTYTSGAQRRAAARREREQERARARAEGGDDTEERDEEGDDANGGDGPGIGIDIPMFGGNPIIVPLGGGRRGGSGDAPPANAQDQPTADGADADAPAEDDTPHTGDHAHDHRLQDIVTIGVDMYIGRGPPPPFAMGGGANVFQFPFPGGAHGPPMNAAPGNPTSTNTNTNHNPDVDAADPPQPSTNGEADAQASDRGNGGGRRGTAFAIPLGQGFGRILGDAFSRIFAGGHAHEHGHREPQAPAANGGRNDNTGSGDGHEGPAMFGPERPPASVRGAVPTMPGSVGIGVGGGRGAGPFPFSFPVGGGGGAPGGGDVPQNGGQQGAGGGTRMFETMIPLLDILFGPRTPTTQTQGEGQAPAQPAPQPSQRPEPQPAPQPAQPQPQHPQPAPHERGNLPTGGFGWTFISGPPGAPPTFMSGSPMPRPASAPVPGRQRQQEPRKLWVLPSAPGLTLRQRVEKKEQEAGLRCCDISCGVGPSDEDPLGDIGSEEMRQVKIRKFEGVSALDSGLVIGEEEHQDHQHMHKQQHQRCDAVCEHTFHSSCLVSAERVASRGVSPAFVGGLEGGEEVEVSCPVCRGVGRVSRSDWENGVRALG